MRPTRLRWLVALALCLAIPLPGRFRAAEAPGPPRDFDSLEALNATYARRAAELDRRKVADLAALSARSLGSERDAVDRELFDLAIARGCWAEAMPAAGRSLASATSPPDNRPLATLVVLLTRTDRGETEEALAVLRSFLAGHAKPQDAGAVLALGEAYLQRLLRSGRHALARKAGTLLREASADPVARRHFDDRLGRLDLLGKPAPAIETTDLDGRPARLADLKGKVVLVDFWATWCPPCVAAIPMLKSLSEREGGRGLEVLGVNLDARHEDVKDARSARANVRRFLVESGVSWPNVLDGDGDKDLARAYKVEHIPANFLIGRDGTIVGFELSGSDLERAVAEALGKRAE